MTFIFSISRSKCITSSCAHGGLVEIKRIFVGADCSLTKALYKRRICRETSQGSIINRNHKFYYQVQLQMHCTHCKWTDLVLSDTKDMVILHVKNNSQFLADKIPKLEKFYEHISLELAYPRLALRLPRLGKVIRRDV